MGGKAVVVTTDGRMSTQERDAPPTLEEVQAWLGGDAEPLDAAPEAFEGQPCQMYCNAEGKLLGMPYNDRATKLTAIELWSRGDVINGPLVILVGAARWD